MDKDTLSLLVIIALLIVYIIVQNITHRQERQDLYNRIMAKNLQEYSGSKPSTVKNILRKNYSRQNTPK